MSWRVLTAVVLASLGWPALATAGPEEPFRYVGWVGVGDLPNRYFTEGDAVSLNFRYLGPAVTYRVCWTRIGSRRQRCWTRTPAAPAYVSRVKNLQVPKPFGPWVARWYVRGREVASWRFYTASEGA